MITIQPEKEEYYTAIHELNVLAFGREDETRLVENLRKTSGFIPDFSLVALKEGRVIGHILFTSIAIQTKNDTLPALALAPMAIHPEFQNRGIGSELVRQGLERCRKLGYKVVIVVGHPTYYPRFGFIHFGSNTPRLAAHSSFRRKPESRDQRTGCRIKSCMTKEL